MTPFKIISTVIFLFFSCPAFAQFTKAEVQVSGLTCSMCQLSTQKALKTLPFITGITPDLKRNLFVLTFKKDMPVDLGQIRKKIQGAGFSVNKLVASFHFNNLAVSNNFHYTYEGVIYHFMNVTDRTLNGDVALNVISNGFIPVADYKRFAAQTTYPCYKSGVMGKDPVIHVTI